MKNWQIKFTKKRIIKNDKKQSEIRNIYIYNSIIPYYLLLDCIL